ncbi:hypothetical protein SAMN05444920_106458 [Nonomuraea solani]|uniref:Uncharacterized protein n=1 Tax=Nonomuraea solani TaxID=1144553 RepID=A0A1H6DWB9_9ACTN|nr:hypothetical protein [Nonomuraea solani]SEG89489.1 hypothetical protein SAMN05444920_106458 [Nonomuraea solani]
MFAIVRGSRIALTALGLSMTAVMGLNALPAQAAAFEKVCSGGGPVTGSRSCVVDFSNFPGGTISLDVETTGSITVEHDMHVEIDGRGFVCSGKYRPSDPPRSFVCHNIPRGNGAFGAFKPPQEATRVAVRW